MTLKRIGLAAFFAAVFAGCAVGPNYHTPRVATPDRYAETANGTSPDAAAPQVDPASWWHSLADPELDSLVERAVLANPDLRVALDRLQAARVFEAAVIGAVLPDAGASAGAGRGTGNDVTRGRVSPALHSADNASGLQHLNEVGGFDSVWELDIFGRYRREIEAARYDEQATRAARNAVLVSVIADVARAYVDLRGLQVRASVLNSAVAVLRESLRIVSIRYQRGITNELDVTLATRELASLEAQAAPINAQVRAAEYTLATLLGLYPEDLVRELDVPGMVPSVPSAVDAGLPPQQVRRQPCVDRGRHAPTSSRPSASSPARPRAS